MTAIFLNLLFITFFSSYISGEIHVNTYTQHAWEKVGYTRNATIDSGYYVFGSQEEYYIDLYEYGFEMTEYKSNMSRPFMSETREIYMLYLSEDIVNVDDTLFEIMKTTISASEFITLNKIDYFYYCSTYPYVVTTPVLVNDDNTFYTFVSDNKSVTEFTNKIEIYDHTDKELIYDSLKIVSDDYTSNMNTCGEYSVVINVTNSNGKSKDFTFEIIVINDKKPTLLHKIDEITEYIIDLNDLDFYLEQFVIYDYIDGYIPNSKIKILEDNYSKNMTKEGIYHVYIEIINSNYESIEHKITFNIKNNTHPFIFSPEELIVSKSCLFDMNIITNEIISRDFDGQSLSYEIIENTYNLTNIPGDYYITFKNINSNGYESTTTTNIKVTSSIIDYYYYDDIVIIENYTELTDNDLLEIFSSINNYTKVVYNYTITSELNETTKPNNVFVSILDYDNNIIIDGRIVIVFLNIEIVEDIEEIIDDSVNYDFIFIIVICSIIVGSVSFYIYKKRN